MKTKIFLTILLSITSLALYSERCQPGNLNYEVNDEDGTASVSSSCEYVKTDSLVIPSEIYSYGKAYSVVEISSDAFTECDKLRCVIVPPSVKKLDGFGMCSNLEHISLSDNIEEIGAGVFAACVNLKEIVLPHNLKEINEATFACCVNLKEIVLPHNLKVISKATFFACFSLTEIEIPNNVTYISRYAFQKCINLKSITIGKSVKYIDMEAFAGCSNITDITCFAPEPPQCKDDSVFYKVNKSASIHVLPQSVDLYKQAYVWKDFNIVGDADRTYNNCVRELKQTENEKFELELSKRQDANIKLLYFMDSISKHSTIDLQGMTAAKEGFQLSTMNYLNEFERTFYYEEAVQSIFDYNEPIIAEYNKNGHCFSTKDEFFNAYISSDYKAILEIIKQH